MKKKLNLLLNILRRKKLTQKEAETVNNISEEIAAKDTVLSQRVEKQDAIINGYSTEDYENIMSRMVLILKNMNFREPEILHLQENFLIWCLKQKWKRELSRNDLIQMQKVWMYAEAELKREPDLGEFKEVYKKLRS